VADHQLQADALSPAIGVEVRGVDLTRPLDAPVVDELRRLFRAHRLLLFRDQSIDEDDQIRLVAALGDVIVEVPTGERYCWVSNELDEGKGYVGGSNKISWHSDYAFTEHGPLHGISLCATVLERAEPTSWANMVRAVELLPDELRRRVEKVEVFQLLDLSRQASTSRRNRLSEALPSAPAAQYPHSVHPIIERHPLTGEPVICVSDFMSSHIVGWTDADSDELFAELGAVAYAAGNCYTHQWQVNDLIVWDNVALQHSRNEFVSDGLRILRRVAMNDVDVPTLMRDVRADAERAPSLQWADADTT
jgi:alpha-ketoglutarate-dependent taurine dioxygenase